MRLAKFETSQPVLVFSQKRQKREQVTDYRTRIITTTTTDDSWQIALAIPDFKAISRDIKRTWQSGIRAIKNALIDTFIPQPLYAG